MQSHSQSGKYILLCARLCFMYRASHMPIFHNIGVLSMRFWLNLEKNRHRRRKKRAYLSLDLSLSVSLGKDVVA